jgi:hypothetical protein
LPKCEICGKELKNPYSKNHINSQYHQKALRSVGKEISSRKVKPVTILESSSDLRELKIIVSKIENRLSKVEEILKIETLKGKFRKKAIILNDKDIEKLIINVISQKSNRQQIKGNFILKDIRDTLIKEYNVPEYKFEETILRLYRKQLVDLQSGGNPNDYHILSPTGKKFYYLKAKIN